MPSKSVEEYPLVSIYAFCTRLDMKISFWKENPELKDYEPYSHLVESEGDKRSAKIMDAVYMFCDPKALGNSRRLDAKSEKNIKKQIATVVFRGEEFAWDKYQYIIDAFISDSRTPLEKDIYFLEDQIRVIKTGIIKKHVAVEPKERIDILLKVKQLVEDKDALEQRVLEERKNITLRKGVRTSRVELL